MIFILLNIWSGYKRKVSIDCYPQKVNGVGVLAVFGRCMATCAATSVLVDDGVADSEDESLASVLPVTSPDFECFLTYSSQLVFSQK